MTAALKDRVEPAYEWGMRRTVPSQQPAHAVRVPEIRRLAAEWSRAHKAVTAEKVLAFAEALWRTGWREERILGLAILARRKAALAAVDWATIERWSAEIDNWEHVDNMAGLLAGPMLVQRPQLVSSVLTLAASPQVWQRRLAIVTLIEAAREDSAWLPELHAIAEQLKGDRGPTMRKAVDWARRTAQKLETR